MSCHTARREGTRSRMRGSSHRSGGFTSASSASAVDDLSHEVDAAARQVGLVRGLHVGRTTRGAEAAVDAVEDQFVLDVRAVGLRRRRHEEARFGRSRRWKAYGNDSSGNDYRSPNNRPGLKTLSGSSFCFTVRMRSRGTARLWGSYHPSTGQRQGRQWCTPARRPRSSAVAARCRDRSQTVPIACFQMIPFSALA